MKGEERSKNGGRGAFGAARIEIGREKDPRSLGYQYEAALQDAWGGLNFDRTNLLTTDQQQLRILNPGKHNFDQGPDFLQAEIQIGGNRHVGHVELHLDSDDWIRHGHHRDKHYDAVVLHVFLRQGMHNAKRSDGTEIPGLWLGDRIRRPIMASKGAALPCAGLGRDYLPPRPGSWLEEAGTLRLRQKSEMLRVALAKTGNDWGQLLWEELAVALGGPVNGPCFRQFARQLPWALVRRQQFLRQSLEALLFGSVGMLDGRAMDAYQSTLKETWDFLKAKYNLTVRPQPFKFHRMHPAGFPTVRIAQLAGLIHHYQPIYQLLEVAEVKRFVGQDIASMGEYWAHRYEFGNTLNTRKSELGLDARVRISANVLVPLGLLYQQMHRPHDDGAEYLGLLRSLPAEHNKVTRKFDPLGLQPTNALQSQGMIGIERSHCSTYRCLECPIGAKAIYPIAAVPALATVPEPTQTTLLPQNQS